MKANLAWPQVKDQAPRECDALTPTSAEEVGRATEGRWFSVTYIRLRGPWQHGLQEEFDLLPTAVLCCISVLRKEMSTIFIGSTDSMVYNFQKM